MASILRSAGGPQAGDWSRPPVWWLLSSAVRSAYWRCQPFIPVHCRRYSSEQRWMFLFRSRAWLQKRVSVQVPYYQ